MNAAQAIEKVLGAVKRTEPVEGSPYQPGERVRVVGPGDNTFPDEYLDRTGTVVHLEYDCGSGQTFPGDPMIGIAFDFDEGAKVREFWRDEIESIP